MRHSPVLLSLCLLGACTNSRTVDIGEGGDKNGNTGVVGASLSDYVGKWDGYAEAKEWNDGKDRVRLRLDENGDGVLEVGDSDPLPEPDPEAAFPPNSGGGDATSPFFGPPPGLQAGFSYPVSDAIVESRRLRMETTTLALYEEWCAAMTPIENPGALDENGNQGYTCVDPIVFQTMVVSCKESPNPEACGKGSCQFVCFCDENACGVREASENDVVKIDAALENDGEELVGTLLVEGSRITVRMTRE